MTRRAARTAPGGAIADAETACRMIAAHAGVDTRTARAAILDEDFASNMRRMAVGKAISALRYDATEVRKGLLAGR